jgi:hypothetical protein
MAQATPTTISTKQLATRLGVHEKTLRRQCLAGLIPVHCYSKGGPNASYRFFTIAVDYLCDHGTWPTQPEMARFARTRRAGAGDDRAAAARLVSLHLGELEAELPELDDPRVLHEALAIELGRRNRKGAVSAMRRRLLEIEGAADAAA